MWIIIIEIPLTVSEIPLTVSEIPLTVSGISLTYNPKETRVAYAVQYEDLFFKVKFHLRSVEFHLRLVEFHLP
jgi:hypothetical protein